MNDMNPGDTCWVVNQITDPLAFANEPVRRVIVTSVHHDGCYAEYTFYPWPSIHATEQQAAHVALIRLRTCWSVAQREADELGVACRKLKERAGT